MVIVKLVVGNKDEGDAVANSLLKNNFTLNVFASAFDSYHLSSAFTTIHTEVYVIQFLTKSTLYNEIESRLKKEFPQTDFYLCATPIVHMAINLHDKIKKRVVRSYEIDEDTDN
ncbi:MAG: hypothetical protein WKF35_05075 [Ferruginibacter sp.]